MHFSMVYLPVTDDSKQLHLKTLIVPEVVLTYLHLHIYFFHPVLKCSCLWLAEPALAVYVTTR